MTKVNVLDSLDHSLTSSIRNFSAAADALGEDQQDLPFAKDLLRASIAQLKKALEDLRKSENNLSMAARKSSGEV